MVQSPWAPSGTIPLLGPARDSGLIFLPYAYTGIVLVPYTDSNGNLRTIVQSYWMGVMTDYFNTARIDGVKFWWWNTW